ncbi:NAD-dependent malic enzyme [Candidatus Woesearchaeota archaeon]|nr:NAD-dependent malic enzyme [Candidatus Woesearchaeota archaeon]
MQNIDNKKTEKKAENKAEALTEKNIEKQTEKRPEKKPEGQTENDAIQLHKELKGKIEIISKSKVTKDSLKLLYTPGVAYPCLEISKEINQNTKNSKEKCSKENNNNEKNSNENTNKENNAKRDYNKEKDSNNDLLYEYTGKGNFVAVITDGSAVLGLGNIGAEASLPVMEGKAILFKEFADINAFPIAIISQNTDEIINIVKNISPIFGGINLEDISAPRCFEIEQRLKKELNIPVFHDDQHGTAIVVLAALTNALKVVKKDISNIKVVINGAGAAGISIAKLLSCFQIEQNCYGNVCKSVCAPVCTPVKEIILCDTTGIIYEGRKEGMNSAKEEIANQTNKKRIKGTLKDAIKDADVFIGVSAPNIVTEEMIVSMAKDSIVFAMSNPVPEIMPEIAKKAGARIVGTGRSDFNNQINNVLAFPGVFKGTLSVRASSITNEMKIAAANALAACIPEKELTEDYVIPSPFDKQVVEKVAKAVAGCAVKQKINRI